MTVKLDPRSDRNLQGVHQDLVNVIRTVPLVRPDIGFVVIDGKRALQIQKQYFAAGKSRTMDSRHLTGHAADIARVINGVIVWEPWVLYEELAQAMFQAAHLNGTTIEWGGHFGSYDAANGFQPFHDGLHFQLPRGTHPDPKPAAKPTKKAKTVTVTRSKPGTKANAKPAAKAPQASKAQPAKS